MKIALIHQSGGFYPYSEQDRKEASRLTNAVYVAELKTMDLLSEQQRRSIWLWAQLISDHLNDIGFHAKTVFGGDVAWNKKRVKTRIIDEVIDTFGKDSSTKLDKEEVNTMIDTITGYFAGRGVELPAFPNRER